MLILRKKQLQEISRSLGVPEDLDVEIETGEPTYYEAGGALVHNRFNLS